MENKDLEFTTEKAERYEKEYSEDGFWNKLKNNASRAGATLVYAALQLYYVMLSSKVPLRDKAIIAGALGYLILPTDLIPDLLPAVGYADDLSALIAVFNRVKVNISDEIKEKARQKTIEIMGDVSTSTFDMPMFKDK